MPASKTDDSCNFFEEGTKIREGFRLLRCV
jgi:hypothetical protein